MNKRNMLLGAVAALLILNIWRWTGDETVTPTRARPGVIAPSALGLKFGTAADAAIARDLFYPKAQPVVARAAPAPVAAVPPPPPEKTAAELELEAARAELARIKCAAIAFDGERGRAFMLNGSESYTVKTGDKVGGRFVVEEITREGVRLRDPATALTGQLQVSGS